MTNTNKREWIFPGHNVVCDDNDVALSAECHTPEATRKLGREIATKRGEMVYAYLGNGREAIEPAPVVGMGCTVVFLVDRFPGTVIAVSKSGHRVTVREDRSIRLDDNGMSQCQDYRFERSPAGEGREHTMYRQGDGRYGKAPCLVLGMRERYHCYEF